jgi:hypothetical protein
MEQGNIVELGIRAAVRRSEAVISKIKPYVKTARYQSNSPINGLVKFGVVKEVADDLMKTLDLFKTDDKKTLTVPKHLKASGRPQAANIVDVVCIVKFGREKKLVAKGKKLGLVVKEEETLKEGKKVGKIIFAFHTQNSENATSLIGLINSQEKIERVVPGK